MTKEGLTKTDISSAEDNDLKHKRKCKQKTILPITMESLCPTYSDFEDESNDNYNDDIVTTFQVTEPRVNGWSPSPKKLKSSQTTNSSTNKYLYSKPSVSRQLSYASTDKKKKIMPKPLTNDKTDIDDNISFGSDDSVTALPSESQSEEIQKNVTNKMNIISSIEKQKLPQASHVIDTPTTLTTSDRGFQKEVLYRLAYVKHELKRLVNNQMDIAQRIESIETRLEVNTISNTSNNCNNTSSLNEISDCILPLDNTTDLDTFNDKISGDRAFQINLTNQLSYIGGKHFKSMIKRIMNKLFSDELLQYFSYSGKSGKKLKFSNLAVCSVILDAVKQQPKYKNKVSESEMEEVIKNVLAQAPFNIKRKTQKL